ncbi:MAG: hypothetical protein IT306_20560 [Chloroflexi bacterium]|nr:hypothetical protein [Chloroflexota bacterium]
MLTLMLTMMATLGVASAQVTAEERPLTSAEEASIRQEMATLYGILLQGGKAPQEAKLAVNAVGVCLGAAYMHDLTRQQADAVCGEVLDAFTVQPGTVLYTLTPEDRAWIMSRTTGWTEELSALLEPDELAAVRTTMGACLEGHMRRNEGREGSVRACARGLLPLLNRPELQQLLLEAANRLP